MCANHSDAGPAMVMNLYVVPIPAPGLTMPRTSEDEKASAGIDHQNNSLCANPATCSTDERTPMQAKTSEVYRVGRRGLSNQSFLFSKITQVPYRTSNTRRIVFPSMSPVPISFPQRHGGGAVSRRLTPVVRCQYHQFLRLANFAAIVGFPLVSFLTVKSSALSLARRRLFSEPSRASLVF